MYPRLLSRCGDWRGVGRTPYTEAPSARARARPHTTSLRPRKSEEEKRTCCTATSSRVSTAVREVVFPVSRETLALGLTVGGPIDWLSTGRVLWAMLRGAPVFFLARA